MKQSQGKSPPKKCSATRIDGRPCQAWAKSATRLLSDHPPLCSAHQHKTPASTDALFYQTAYSLEEIADLLDLAMVEDLDEELAAVRVVLRRAILKLGDDLPQAEYTRLISAVFSGAATIARLMQTHRSFDGAVAKVINDAIPHALDQLSDELGINL